jgi:hypothetical protein
MATLQSITAYRGRFILEYSHGTQAKPARRFFIENLPKGPLPVGSSLNDAKRVIDGLEVRAPV